MSIPVLNETYDELRRLAIAGSAVAPGDFRLKKLIPALEKSGEKAPVFMKVAQAARAVVESDDASAPAALLEAATLVGAILATQGTIGAEGERTPIDTIGLELPPKQVGANLLKPVLEALRTKGSGRIDVVAQAVSQDAFRDLRLVAPALAALDDSYPDLADMIAEKVLPLYGRAIVPELLASVDRQGRGGHVRRLRLVQQLDPVAARELVRQTLEDGSKEMKVAAIECLGGHPDDDALLAEMSKSKNREVRAAALRALARSERSLAHSIEVIKQALVGDDLATLVAEVRRSPHDELRTYALAQAKRVVEECVNESDGAKQGKGIERARLWIACLDERRDAEVESFLLDLFARRDPFAKIKSTPGGADLNELVAERLAVGLPTMQSTLAAAYDSLKGRPLDAALIAARATLTPEAFFQKFSPFLAPVPEKRAKGDADSQQVGEAVARALEAVAVLSNIATRISFEGALGRHKAATLPPADERWLDVACTHGLADLVHLLARPRHEGVRRWLRQQYQEVKRDKIPLAFRTLETLFRIEDPDAVELLVDWIKTLVETRRERQGEHWIGVLVHRAPVSVCDTLEQLAPTLPEKLADHLQDVIARRRA